MRYRIARVLVAVGLCLVFLRGSQGDGARSMLAAVDTRAVPGATISQATAPSIAGTPVPALQGFDDAITALMVKWQIPGATLAVVNNGHLVLAHGYGLADVDANQPVQPDSLFRIASLSKSFTAAGILLLVEQGKLDLDAPAFAMLDQLPPLPGASVDPRLATITVRELLQHTGGWDRDESLDPIFRPGTVARAAGTPPPASCETTIRYMRGQPLDFDPGTRYAYSNFGYCVLGRIIEKVAGQPYADFITAQILMPAGITRMQLGHTLADRRAAGEVRYYGYPGQALVTAVFPSVSGQVTVPYGGFNLEGMDALGGWIASAVDLVKFMSALDGRRPPALLQPQTLGLLTARPAPPVSVGAAAYDAGGFYVRPVSNGANWFHGGVLPGTHAYMVRFENGPTYAVVFNADPKETDTFRTELDRALATASGQIKDWPVNDLFAQYP